MTALVPLARVLLAGVFAFAGLAKLRDREGSRRSLSDFGVPAAAVAPLAGVLAVIELALAAALLPRTTAIWGALGAIALLVAFVAAIAVALAHGRRPSCHCFGQFHSRPIGWQVLARNGVLLASAVFIVAAGWPDGGASLVAWLVPLTLTERFVLLSGSIGIALLVAQLVLVTRLVGQVARLTQGAGPASDIVASSRTSSIAPSSIAVPSALAIGSDAPAFSLRDLDGEATTLDALRAPGKPIVLVFSDPDCGTCMALLPEIAAWQRELASSLTVAVISRGTLEANRDKIRAHGVKRVLLQRNQEVAEAYRVIGTPAAVLIQPDGALASLPSLGDAAVRALVAQGLRSAASVAPAAPDIALPDLERRPVTLANFRGRPTLLLFWNPACGFCRRMLPDLKRWETRTGRPHLLVVSTGSAADNQKLGLRSTIVLDADFAVARQYGVQGTPSAVLVDAAGRIGSDVLVGAPAIFARVGPPEGAGGSAEKTGLPGAIPNAPVHAPSAGVEAIAVEAAASAAGALEPGARPLRAAAVHDELLPDGSMILYHGARNQVLTLNGTGALVWECCDGRHDMPAIAAEVRDVFPAAETADRDVRDLLIQLWQAGMIAAAGDTHDGERSAHPGLAAT